MTFLVCPHPQKYLYFIHVRRAKRHSHVERPQEQHFRSQDQQRLQGQGTAFPFPFPVTLFLLLISLSSAFQTQINHKDNTDRACVDSCKLVDLSSASAVMLHGQCCNASDNLLMVWKAKINLTLACIQSMSYTVIVPGASSTKGVASIFYVCKIAFTL